MGLLEDIGQALYQTYSVGPNQAIDQVSNQLASILSNIPAEKWVSGEQEAAKRIGEVRGKQTSPTDVGQLATLGGMLGSYADSASPIFGLEGIQKAASDVSPALGITAEMATDPFTYLGGGGKAAAGAGVKVGAELPALLAMIGSKIENPKNWKVAQTLAELFTKEVPMTEKIAAQDVELLKKFSSEKELARIHDLVSKLPSTPKQLTELESLQKKINKAGKRFAKSGEAITPVNKAGTTVGERYANPEVRQDIAKQVLESRQAKTPVTSTQTATPIKTNTPVAIEPIVNQLAELIRSNPKTAMGITAGSVAIPELLGRLTSGGYTPQTQPMQPVGANNAQTQGSFAKGFAPGTAANQLVNQLQQAQQQAVTPTAQATGNSPQDILMKIAQAILMQGGGGASIEQIADLIYKSGALRQQEDYRNAQIKEMGSREARTNAAIQISRQAIEEPYQSALTLSRMNPNDKKLAEEARKAREERDRKLAEFDKRVYGSQQAGE